MASKLTPPPPLKSRPILLTGFGAFGSLSTNPSALLVEQLARAGPELRTEILPTSYVRAWKMMQILMRERPRLVVMFGYSRHAVGLRLERYARNEDRAETRDNDDKVGRAEIVRGAPRLLAARAPVDALYNRLVAEGIPASLSADAGGYVCNHVYFRTLNLLTRESKGDVRCLLAHVAHWQEADNQNDIVRGAKLLIKTLTRSDENVRLAS
jgi:pyroglutamyl-peptidase